ncbi:2Fe-2S iron-sulfur cluster-binding protein [Streptomyces sp. NPDC057474]|uniref:2Fe-2S iron-sulfur cluster-binding protein n=1 Tax=Streptomyces sp. NPDC057474 TaxID=3346144 RepID=UPI00368412B7
MAEVTFRFNGQTRTIDVPDGTSLMKAAVESGIDGIIGECGGNAMCATCHVYTDPADAGRLPEAGEDEDEMLDCTAAERRDGSRLSCQLVASPDLAGLTVEVPEDQR